MRRVSQNIRGSTGVRVLCSVRMYVLWCMCVCVYVFVFVCVTDIHRQKLQTDELEIQNKCVLALIRFLAGIECANLQL